MSLKNPRISLYGGGKPPHATTQQIAETLGQRYEELNKLLERAEASLKQIPVPVDVYFAYLIEDMFPDEPGMKCYSYLGFVRTEMTERSDHPMPQLTDVDRVARVLADRLPHAPATLDFPQPLALAVRLAAHLPRSLRDVLAKRQPWSR